MRYLVQLQKTEEGYSVCCPILPGCWSQGDTENEALENIKDAIEWVSEKIVGKYSFEHWARGKGQGAKVLIVLIQRFRVCNCIILSCFLGKNP